MSHRKHKCGEMMDESAPREDVHKKLAVDLFNLTWNLLDKKDRMKEEDDKMIHAAHASRFHWGEVGTPLEFERGEWQISRVYSVLKRSEPAIYHAQRCLEICKQQDIEDFDIAFAYEALARAYAIAGQRARCEENMEQARKAGEQIKKADDKKYFFSELETIKC
jgi:hypothetical protein